jgi:hypothetical protein
MSKIKPNTKEQLVDYLSKYISLGTYDKRFLTNLIHLNFTTKNPVTTNQSALLDTIVKRYHRQLAKKEIDSNEMINLPWTLAPIPSLPTYTEAHISIEDESILLRSPYKTAFVKDIKTFEYGNWNRDTKTWSFPMNELLLKNVIDVTNKHYDSVNYCDVVKEVIEILYPYEETKYWNPTLVKVNDMLYIAACNEPLMKSIQDIPLTLDVKNLARLAFMGITISDDIKNSLSLEEQLGIEYTISIDKNDVDGIIRYLKMIDTDFVLLSDRYRQDREYLLHLANHLKANKINHQLSSKTILSDENVSLMEQSSYEMPVLLNLGTITLDASKHSAKVLCIVNNNPVKVYR